MRIVFGAMGFFNYMPVEPNFLLISIYVPITIPKNRCLNAFQYTFNDR